MSSISNEDTTMEDKREQIKEEKPSILSSSPVKEEQKESNNGNPSGSGSGSSSAIKNGEGEYLCKWVECDNRNHSSLTTLVDHLNTKHLAHMAHLTPTAPIRYTCQWEECPRFGIEQPSRFALISHCRTHTGEKPYFCPIPECEKHFTRSDALAKHVKGVHDLHSAKDALALIKDKVKKKKIEPFVEDHNLLVEEDYLSLIEEEHELKNPWWFSKSFLNILKSEDGKLGWLNQIPLNTKQYKIANGRYNSYVKDKEFDLVYCNEDEEFFKELNQSAKAAVSHDDGAHDDSYDIENITDVQTLKQVHNKLAKKLQVASKINKVVTKQLAASVREKRKTWLVNQYLIDANISLGLPEKAEPGKEDDPKITLDKIDDDLLGSL